MQTFENRNSDPQKSCFGSPSVRETPVENRCRRGFEQLLISIGREVMTEQIMTTI